MLCKRASTIFVIDLKPGQVYTCQLTHIRRVKYRRFEIYNTQSLEVFNKHQILFSESETLTALQVKMDRLGKLPTLLLETDHGIDISRMYLRAKALHVVPINIPASKLMFLNVDFFKCRQALRCRDDGSRNNQVQSGANMYAAIEPRRAV